MSAISSIAINTYRESIRSKILYVLLFFAVLLVLIATSFSTVTIGDQVKVIKDFGLFCVSLFSASYVSIGGAALLHKELSKKTIYNILSKPVYRYEFVLGKYFGMLLTVATMVVLMSIGLSLFVAIFDGQIDWSLYAAGYSIMLQLIIVAAFAIFFSTIVVTPMLSGAFTFATFLAGRSSEYLLYFVESGKLSGFAAWSLKVLHSIVPNLDSVDLSNSAVYGLSLGAEAVFWPTIYSLGYSGILLVMAVIFFSRREFN